MVANELATKEDLNKLGREIMEAIGTSLDNSRDNKEWLRSKEVQEMLGISASGLQNLRIKGIIPFSKIEGTLFYPRDGILQVLNDNMNRPEK